MKVGKTFEKKMFLRFFDKMKIWNFRMKIKSGIFSTKIKPRTFYNKNKIWIFLTKIKTGIFVTKKKNSGLFFTK